MVDLQKNFVSFHDKIKLSYDENSLLRTYRDKVLGGLTEFLDINQPFKDFVQGSYSVYTGIKSSDANIDFDIDVALVIDISTEEYSNPVALKKLVRDAMVSTFSEAQVTIKNPCVTITFTDEDNGENVHVDIAVYANEDGNYFLARGKEFSNSENRSWEEADPIELKNKINNYSTNTDDRKQFRRCIRYLKRWKDNKFNQENRPTGIGITVLALEKFRPNKATDYFAGTTTYNDLRALKEFVTDLCNSFTCLNYDEVNQTFYHRIEAPLPVKPRSDTFCKMTANQMTSFKEKLGLLREDLEYALQTLDEHEATKKLNKQFGDDFEVVAEEAIVEASSRNAFVSDYPSA